MCSRTCLPSPNCGYLLSHLMSRPGRDLAILDLQVPSKRGIGPNFHLIQFLHLEDVWDRVSIIFLKNLAVAPLGPKAYI